MGMMTQLRKRIGIHSPGIHSPPSSLTCFRWRRRDCTGAAHLLELTDTAVCIKLEETLGHGESRLFFKRDPIVLEKSGMMLDALVIGPDQEERDLPTHQKELMASHKFTGRRFECVHLNLKSDDVSLVIDLGVPSFESASPQSGVPSFESASPQSGVPSFERASPQSGDL